MFNSFYEESENVCPDYEVYGLWEPQTEECNLGEPEPMDERGKPF